MTMEYWDKLRAFIKWLIPFAVAVFLLFGCGPQGMQAAPETEAAAGLETGAAALETEAAAVLETGAAALETEAAESMEIGSASSEEKEAGLTSASIEENGTYTSKEEVALYLHTYGRLPDNFMTKKEAEAAGWVSKEGNLWEVAPGMSIGGSRFGNYEENLPDAEGRIWYECDINFDGTYRGTERIVYSSDGLIYYTGDHYETFEQLY